MRIKFPLYISFIALFLGLFSPSAQALTPAASISCCTEWSQTGIRPSTCEAQQTEDVCEKELNHPTANYTLACWPNENDPICRANVDATIAQARRDRERQPIDLNNNGVISGEFIEPVVESATIFGLSGFALGCIVTAGISSFLHRSRPQA